MIYILYTIFCIAPAALIAYALFMYQENRIVKSGVINKRLLISGAIGIGLLLLLITMY